MRSNPGDELECMLQHFNRIPVSEPCNGIVCCEDKVAHGMLILPAILEMQREFRGRFLFSIAGSAERLDSLSNTPVQPRAPYVRESLIENLPIQGVSELVMSREGT